jgi:predicted AAA+ superfamily ATPase
VVETHRSTDDQPVPFGSNLYALPKLFLAIKAAIDRQRLPSSFLLAGSANPLLLPKLLESLVGRMEMLTLWPFSQDEL